MEADITILAFERFRRRAEELAVGLRQMVIDGEPLTKDEARELRAMLKELRRLQDTMRYLGIERPSH